MEKILLLIIILLNLLPYQFGTMQEKNPIEKPKPKDYEIMRIKRIKNIYVIYVLQNKEKFQIVSRRSDSVENCCKIRKGKKYRFVLKPYFENSDLSRFTVTHADIDGTIIPLDKDYDNNIYFSSNLNGLCYIPITNGQEKDP